MNGNCHLVFGAAIGTAAALNVDKLSSIIPNLTATPETTALLILGSLVGSVFPDIDNPVSYIGKLTSPVSGMFGFFGKLTGKTGKNHRGIMHDGFIYLAGLFLCCQYYTPLIGFFIGCLSHLFLDLFNPSGIPFLFGVKHLHLGRIVSGSKASIIFTWVNVALTLVIGIILKYNLFSF